VNQFAFPGDDLAIWDRHRVLIKSALSGDTVAVRSIDGRRGDSVRLLGIESPEKTARRIGWSQDELRLGLSAFLTKNVAAAPVLLRLEPPQTRESDGRLRAYLYLSDVDNINIDLVRNGLALPDQSECSMMSLLIGAQIIAKKTGAGVWEGWERGPATRSRKTRSAAQ
jgi:endonuclease YncB( thermonuclease family)